MGATLTALAVVAAATIGGATPAAAGPTEADALLFVPYNGQTVGIWRNGVTSYEARITAAAPFEGDFSIGLGTDVFLYNPGPAPDGILHVGLTGTGTTTSFQPANIGGTYQPLVGRFDAGLTDDIFWYAPGPAPDYVWYFDDDGSYTSVPLSVGGTFRPVVVDVDGGAGIEDIIWYAPGAGSDYVWEFDEFGNPSSHRTTIGGNYTPITGYFGDAAEGSPQERLIWFNPSGPDYIWTFLAGGGHTTRTMPNVDGPYQPVVGNFTHPYRENVLFYQPGPGAERFIAFTASGGVESLEPPNVGGTYDTAVGDYDGNGFEDIAWASGGKAYVWRFNGGGYSQIVVTTTTVNTVPHTSHYDTF